MNKFLNKYQLFFLIFLLFYSCASFKNNGSTANIQNEQLKTKIEAYILEIDSLINCRDCKANIAELHSSLVGGRSKKKFGIRYPTLYRGGGGSSDYSRYINCPDSISGIELWDCDTELIYSWTVFVKQHKITRRSKGYTTYTYYQNEEKVAEKKGYNDSWGLATKYQIIYYNGNEVIFRKKSRKKGN